MVGVVVGGVGGAAVVAGAVVVLLAGESAASVAEGASFAGAPPPQPTTTPHRSAAPAVLTRTAATVRKYTKVRQPDECSRTTHHPKRPQRRLLGFDDSELRRSPVKVEIDIRRPRWLPARFSRRFKLLGAVAVLAVVAAPVAVWADHQFPDVPLGSGHEEVSRISDAGIVRGCGTQGLYCPDNPVTRLQMAQFLSRAGGSASATKTALPGALLGGASPNVILTLDATVSGLAGAGRTQRVKVDADVTVRAPSTAGCPCEAMLFLQDETGQQVSSEHLLTISDVSGGLGLATNTQLSVSFVFNAPTDSEQTYFLSGENVTAADPTPDPEPLRAFGELTATTYPFPN